MRPHSLLAALLIAACSSEPGTAPENALAAPTTPATRSSPNATAIESTAPVAPEAGPAASRQAATPKIAVDGAGLRLVDPATGSTRPLAFGTPQADILAALAFRGQPGTGTNAECGSTTYANWPDGLNIVFDDGSFAGWSLDGRADGALTTMSGVGPGATRAALDDGYNAEVRRTTLGLEFTAGTLAGLLDGPGKAAKITNMWAGLTCIAR